MTRVFWAWALLIVVVTLVVWFARPERPPQGTITVSEEAESLLRVIENNEASFANRVKAIRSLNQVLTIRNEPAVLNILMDVASDRADVIAFEILVTVKEHGDSSLVPKLHSYAGGGILPGRINTVLADAIEACEAR